MFRVLMLSLIFMFVAFHDVQLVSTSYGCVILYSVFLERFMFIGLMFSLILTLCLLRFMLHYTTCVICCLIPPYNNAHMGAVSE